MASKYSVVLCLTSENCEYVDEDELEEFDTKEEAMAFMDEYAGGDPVADVYAAELYLYEDGKQIYSMLLSSL